MDLIFPLNNQSSNTVAESTGFAAGAFEIMMGEGITGDYTVTDVTDYIVNNNEATAYTSKTTTNGGYNNTNQNSTTNEDNMSTTKKAPLTLKKVLIWSFSIVLGIWILFKIFKPKRRIKKRRRTSTGRSPLNRSARRY